MNRDPAMLCINRRMYHVSDEPAEVMLPNFTEVAKVQASTGEWGLLYQCVRTGRLAFAHANITTCGPLAVFLTQPKVH